MDRGDGLGFWELWNPVWPVLARGGPFWFADAAVIARQPPLLPHCAAPHAVHVVSHSDLRRTSRFLGIS
ncbi:hypothetical protein PISMIDRAFT_8482 [Pisolithus microcarpus 441]|uniref:Uncharacterized protein n=1 Tax=Pisolithus microcarpus 441 TaxID=765257 RepID=A0A0C9YQH9_9AGAM|nr:hypothetical protein PISMIDRAFT_8482 [Pisolithus microcarpus 441]